MNEGGAHGGHGVLGKSTHTITPQWEPIHSSIDSSIHSSIHPSPLTLNLSLRHTHARMHARMPSSDVVLGGKRDALVGEMGAGIVKE